MTTIAREMVEERVRRMLVHDFVRKEVARAGFGGLSIQRTPLGTHVRIQAERPGIVIGRKGVDINRLTEELERTFGYENLQVEAAEVETWALNPDVMASKVASPRPAQSCSTACAFPKATCSATWTKASG